MKHEYDSGNEGSQGFYIWKNIQTSIQLITNYADLSKPGMFSIQCMFTNLGLKAMCNYGSIDYIRYPFPTEQISN